MKKISVIAALLLVTAVTLSGCSNFVPASSEIDNFDVVELIGFDKNANDPTLIDVTEVSHMQKQSSGSGGGSSGVEHRIITGSGKTIFDAQRKIRAELNKYTFVGYVKYIVLGENAAAQDFNKYYDYFIRDHESRLTPKIFIARGCSAQDLIKRGDSEEYLIDERLKNIVGSADLIGTTAGVEVIDTMMMLESEYSATVIPALQLAPPDNFKLSKMPENSIIRAGYAIIRNNKLIGYIDDSIALGYNFLTNKIDSCPISVEDPNGKFVGLEVNNADTTVSFSFKGDELDKIKIKTKIGSDLAEQHSQDDMTSKEALEAIGGKQSEMVKTLMEAVIEKSKSLGSDCFGITEQLLHKHPYKWEKLKNDWDNIFPELNIEVEVMSKVRRTYDIENPIGYREKEEK